MPTLTAEALRPRLAAVQKEMKRINKSTIGLALSGSHTILLAAYAIGPLCATNVMLAIALSYPPLLNKIKAVENVKVFDSEDFTRQPNPKKMTYPEYLQGIDTYISAYEQRLESLKNWSGVLDNYVQPALLIASIGIATFALPNPMAHSLFAVGLFCTNRLFRNTEDVDVRERLGLRRPT